MKKKLILSAIGILVFAGILWFFNIDWNLLFEAKNPVFLLFGLIAYLLAIAVLAFRAHFFFKQLKEKSVSLKALLKIEFASKFFYYALPGRLNVPFKAIILNKVCGVKKGNAISITTLEYVLDVGFMLLLGLIGLSLFFQELFDSISILKIVISMVALGALILVFFLISTNRFKQLLAKSKKLRNNFLRKSFVFVSKLLFKIRDTWPKILLNKRTIPVLFLLLLNWFFSALSTEFVFLAYGQYVPFLWVLTISAVSLLIGGLSQIPGGVGAKEVTLVVLFIFLGVPQEIVLITALITRLFTLAPMAIGYTFLIQFEKHFKVKLF
jgi:glycosyltransferase 2 family protein